MNRIVEHIKYILLHYTLWMHFTLILVFSYVIMQLSQQLGALIFLGWIGGLLLLSIPVALFVLWRELSYKDRGRLYWAIWLATFLAYPFLLFAIQFDVNSIPFLSFLAHSDIDGSYAFSMLSFLYVGLEANIHQFNLAKKGRKIGVLRKVSPWKIATSLTSVICLLIPWSNTAFTDHIQNLGFLETSGYYIITVVQLFVIYMSYYIYYYIHHHILFNNLLKKSGFIAYFLGIALVILTIVPIHNYIISIFPIVLELKLHSTGLVPEVLDDFNFGIAIFILVVSFPLIVIVEWYKQKNALNELEKQKSESELNLLKSQINPHFFFNTLNNLYAMSLTQDKETPESIMQLSELMRYVIYKGKEDKVKLKDEIKYIKDYVALQMIRSHKNVDYNFEIEDVDQELEIPPLLFIILIENAFKHGIEPAEHPCTLHIKLYQNESQLVFQCVNSLEKSSDDNTIGIGLDNLKRRLKILYDNAHSLILSEKQDRFSATLKIPV